MQTSIGTCVPSLTVWWESSITLSWLPMPTGVPRQLLPESTLISQLRDLLQSGQEEREPGLCQERRAALDPSFQRSGEKWTQCSSLPTVLAPATKFTVSIPSPLP